MYIFNILELSANEQKFLNHYLRLIERGKIKREILLERHHIIPKCMGGSDEDSNITFLTPREHFVAHQLLVKIFPKNSKLIFAAAMMNMGRKLRQHDWIARQKREIQSKMMKERYASGWKGPTTGKFGKDNPNFGKKRSPEQCKRISESLKGVKHPQFGKTGPLSPWWGRSHSEETKAKLRRPRTEETKAKMRKPKTEEHKAKLRGRFVSEETKRKMSISQTGKTRKPVSAETRAKLAEARRGKTLSPESRAKISASRKAHKSS